jgi:DNA invertase Pin-like site-specific DNA recombinase
MEYHPIITEIPATIDIQTLRPLDVEVKLRVAAYARVSTKSDEQLNSYAVQVKYYTEHIKSNQDWVFIRVYTDKGLSGTSLKKRDGFNEMVRDALDGKIDLILTKSASRFVRNTVDGLNTIHKLRDIGVDIFFEELGIHSLDPNSEGILTSHLNMAQEESHNISENVKWGIRKRMKDGKVIMPYKRFLGYKKGANGNPEIDEAGAKIVRDIYKMFLDGRTFNEIALFLTLQGIKTPGGKDTWHMPTVKSILSNEKYAGNAILQKSYTVNFLDKKKKANNGELSQFHLQGSHPAIIPQSTFDLVQAEIAHRKTLGKQISVSGKFVGKIFCGGCGGLYGSKVWHSGSKYRREVWRCNRKYDGDEKCLTPHLTEDEIHNVFIRAWNWILADKERYIAECERKISKFSDVAKLDERADALKTECEDLEAEMRECVRQNARHAQNQESYQKQYDELIDLRNTALEKLKEVVAKRQDYAVLREKGSHFLRFLRPANTPLADFDESLWRAVVESVTIHTRERIIVRFISGIEVFVRVG